MSLFQCPREVLVLPLLDDAANGGIVRNGRRVLKISIILVGDDDRAVGLVEHSDAGNILVIILLPLFLYFRRIHYNRILATFNLWSGK